MSLNPVGKSSVALLHDYVQKILKNSVGWEFSPCPSIATPWRCVAKLLRVATSTQAAGERVLARARAIRRREARVHV